MRRFLVIVACAILGSAACGVGPAAGGHRSPTAKLTHARWSRSGRVANELRSVVATGPGDAWAVGGGEDNSFLMRWRNGVWRTVALPARLHTGPLNAVAASPRGEAWVFGYDARSLQGYKRHTSRFDAWRWNGHAWTLSWSRRDVVVDAAVMVGPHDVWAAGHRPDESGACLGGFLMHRTSAGQTMNITLPSGTCLDAMSALAPDDIWAAGQTRGRPAALHWNGHSWSAARLPSAPGGPQGVLRGVVATSPANVWMVGASGTEREAAKRRTPIALHWDGHGWSRIDTHGIHTAFTRITTDGRGGILVVGTSADKIIFHNDGRSWTREPLLRGWANDIALVPTTSRAIAVGACCDGSDEDTYGLIWSRR